MYNVIGGSDREGAIVVSQIDEPVDYAPLLSGRVANLVPVDDIERVTAAVNAYTLDRRHLPRGLGSVSCATRLPLFGAQRLTSLGYACHRLLDGDATGRDRARPPHVQVDCRRRVCYPTACSRCGRHRLLAFSDGVKPLIPVEVIYERALALLDAEGRTAPDHPTAGRRAEESSTRTLYQQVGSREELIRAGWSRGTSPD